MGRVVADCYGVSPWSIFVRPESRIRRPEDLADVPIAVGMRAGSHFNVPFRLEKYMPLERIKTVNVGGFGARAPLRASQAGGRGGERFVYQPIPRAEFDGVFEQVKRWGLDQYLKERSFENLIYRAAS